MTRPNTDPRRARSIAILEDNGIKGVGAPDVAMDKAASIRSGEQVARRAMCLSIVTELALCGSGAGVRSRLALWGLEESLTAREAAFVAAETPTEHERIRMTWRYESLVPLMWALGLIANLPFPRDTFDPRLPLDFWRTVGKSYWHGAETRAPDEILDESDLIRLLDAVVRDAEQKGEPAPAGLIAGVVAERRHALDWLTGCRSWDGPVGEM